MHAGAMSSSSNASSSSSPPATRSSGSRHTAGIELATAAAEDSADKAALLKLARDRSLTVVTQSVLSQLVTNGLFASNHAPADMSGPVFVAMVNPKSGGNVGTHLLARFKEILNDDRVYNLAEEGPRKGLEDHKDTDNLRIIGERIFNDN